MISKKSMLSALDGLIRSADQLRQAFRQDLRPWSNDFVAWLKAAESTVESIFGTGSEAYVQFRSIHYLPPPTAQHANDPKAHLLWFDSGLNYAIASLTGMRYSVERLAADDSDRPRPFVFVSHGGKTRKHVDGVSEFLSVLGLEPIIVADRPNLNLSINEKVLSYMRLCSAGLALATVEDETTAREKRARPNVENEIGMMLTSHNIGSRIIYLKEDEVKFASNYAEKVWIRFKKTRVQDAFVAIARELRAFGLLGPS
jgi:predicted nucleotide-binding protein